MHVLGHRNHNSNTLYCRFSYRLGMTLTEHSCFLIWTFAYVHTCRLPWNMNMLMYCCHLCGFITFLLTASVSPPTYHKYYVTISERRATKGSSLRTSRWVRSFLAQLAPVASVRKLITKKTVQLQRGATKWYVSHSKLCSPHRGSWI